MKNGGFRGFAFVTIFLIAAAGLTAGDHYRVLNGPKDLYFGHISYLEDGAEAAAPTVRREGAAAPEPGALNLPIGPGDTIRTSRERRCEVQFDTGTIVRLDFATELRVETILARSLSAADELTVLNLAAGRIYVMYKEYDRREMFQVLTANAAVKMKHNAVAFVTAAGDGTTETQVKYGSARVLFGPNADRLEDQAVKKGERLIVLADNQSQSASAIENTAFELWNMDVNAHFGDLHEGLSALPKPLQKLPPAVFYFAQAYGNMYGEWVWDDLYGYVWSPYIDNGRYPWGWSPYYYGFWSYSGGQMFWVPQEPWGWVPYHLGIWQWDKKRGWFWMPGSMFAPAWVEWDFFFGYASWRPWSMFDWLVDDPYMYGSDPYRISYFRYTRSGWDYYWPFTTSGYPGERTDVGPLKTAIAQKTVRRDQLKDPKAGVLPVPAELKGVVRKVADAYAKGDPAVRESAAEVPRHLVFVAKDDLRSRTLQPKTMTWDQVPKQGPPAADQRPAPPWVKDPAREAARIYRGLEGPTGAPRRAPDPGPSTVRGAGLTAVPNGPVRRADGPGEAEGRSGPARFRDWNPDMKVARELGVHIEYSSMRNEVRCPELRLTSRDRVRSEGLTPRMTTDGVRYGSSSAVGGGSDSGPSSGTGTTSGRTQATDRTSTSSSGRETKGSGTSEGGKIKN